MGTGSNCSNSKVTTVSDLLHRVAASCLSQRLPGGRTFDDDDDGWSTEEEEEEEVKRASSVGACVERERENESIAREKVEEEEEEKRLRMWEEGKDHQHLHPEHPKHPPPAPPPPPNNNTDTDKQKDRDLLQSQLQHLEALLSQVFLSVSAVKRSYRSLQHAHCPWDPHHMHLADAAIVSHLRNLDTLRHRFSRRTNHPPNNPSPNASLSLPLRDAVAPYEAALDDLKKQLQLKEAEADNLRHKLHNAEMQLFMPIPTSRKGHTRSHSHSARWAFNPHPTSKSNAPPHVLAGPGAGPGGALHSLHLPVTPIPELFEACMQQVKSASKSFACHLLHLMRAARWDIPAAIHSLLPSTASASQSQFPKYAMESYVNTHLFHGFDHESFYMDGSLASLLDPAAFRRSCFSQFRDMRTMDPTEMLGVLPTCQFGRFAATKYLSLISAKMEESLFAHKEQRQQVMAGTHPRTEFYAEFLRAAKALWMLHLLAFALDPAPTHFEVRKGAEFQPQFMESVLRFTGGRAPPGSVVGFAVAPGFRLGNGSVVCARVYLIPGNPGQ